MFSLFYLYIVRNDDNKDDQSINHNQWIHKIWEGLGTLSEYHCMKT